MDCFNQTGDKRFTDQETLMFRPGTPAAAAADERTQPPRQAACFDCSICLDSAVDPVVTLCGHLYCWPCLYKWMQAEPSSPQPQPQPQQCCPICKAPLSENALVPLYCRGNLPTKHESRLDVPKRPNITRDAIASMMEEEEEEEEEEEPPPQLHYGHYFPAASQRGAASLFGSTARGELLRGLAAVALHPLMSRSDYSTRPYQLVTASSSSPRERRQEMRVEESLHQIWIFLFCGAVLCLLFF